MIVRINELERGERTTKNDKVQEGLWLRGIKMDQEGKFNDEDEYEKFLSEQFDADFIQTIENFGVGSELNLSFVKDGAFWNLDSVTDNKARGGGGNSPGTPKSEDPSPKRNQQSAPDPIAPAEAPVVLASTPVQVRTTALSLAISAMKIGTKLQSFNEKYKLFPLKTTPALLAQTLQTTAESFETFIKAADEKSATKNDREPGSDDDHEPEIPEDDIPF